MRAQISYVAPLMLFFVTIGYPFPLTHILISQSLQESVRGAKYLMLGNYVPILAVFPMLRPNYIQKETHRASVTEQSVGNSIRVGT